MENNIKKELYSFEKKITICGINHVVGKFLWPDWFYFFNLVKCLTKAVLVSGVQHLESMNYFASPVHEGPWKCDRVSIYIVAPLSLI